jgi:hypothetical protein
MSTPEFPTSNPVNPSPPLPQWNDKSAGPPKPAAAAPAPMSPTASPPASAQPPPVMAGVPGVHYDGNHAANQHPAGERAPIPVSRTPWDRPADLDALLFAVGRLKRNAHDWYNDGEWPELEAQLQEWLWILFDDYKQHGMQPALWYDISLVRFFLHLHPLPRDLMVWSGPEHPAKTEET